MQAPPVPDLEGAVGICEDFRGDFRDEGVEPPRGYLPPGGRGSLGRSDSGGGQGVPSGSGQACFSSR
ncbi:hypothetical protein AU468_13270 [Alkalispirochaeta sphaeroplastigenens]|uniref:Uncharacterized protein n=1 Tax=Alkalispirochaeta sphaeroplastigenens TaxID=1187066 RepID=A0A2S4JG59_9SPIO|nr:hypothetical protein AU468_13270 [Alkalispirochaeta sphaeroplastigenens]